MQFERPQFNPDNKRSLSSPSSPNSFPSPASEGQPSNLEAGALKRTYSPSFSNETPPALPSSSAAPPHPPIKKETSSPPLADDGVNMKKAKTTTPQKKQNSNDEPLTSIPNGGGAALSRPHPLNDQALTLIAGPPSLLQSGAQRRRPPPPPPPAGLPPPATLDNRKRSISPPPPVPSRGPPLAKAKTNSSRSGPRPSGKECGDVADYDRIRQVGEGAYGQVFMAKSKKNGRLVALKKFKMLSEKDGFPVPSIREIKILSKLKHENVVDLVEIVTNRRELALKAKAKADKAAALGGAAAAPGGGEDLDDDDEDSSIYMVFEYCEFDLQGLLAASKVDASVRLTAHHVRSYAYQLLEGMAFMHTNRFLHRDLKGCNILVGANNVLKIADWGLARPENDKIKKYTPNLVTLGFRPLEILLGCPKYDSSADIWSAGCILFEFLLRSPLFPVYPKQTETDHVHNIFNVVGTPKLSADASTPGLAADPDYRYDLWPGVTSCPLWERHAAAAEAAPKPRLLQAKFGGNAHEVRTGGRAPRVTAQCSALGVDLLERLLHLDPAKRLGAKEALNHAYFWNKADGEVKRPEQLPKFNLKSAHDLEAKTQAREIHEKLLRQRQTNTAPPGATPPPSNGMGGSGRGASGGL